MLALGIDVGGARNGLDLVLLQDDLSVLETARKVNPNTLADVLPSWRPDVVAIDSPPGWARRWERTTESFIRRLGLSLYQTPWEPSKQSHPFYAWMRVGFEAFNACREIGYRLFDGSESVQNCVIEVFPYASAVVFSGSRRPTGVKMSFWRRSVLYKEGLHVDGLLGSDQIDAGLAALTGMRALEGRFCWHGDPSEGVIILPCDAESLPAKFSDPHPI